MRYSKIAVEGRRLFPAWVVLVAIVTMVGSCVDEMPPAGAPSRARYPQPYGASYTPNPQPPPAPYEPPLAPQAAPTASPLPSLFSQSAPNPTLWFSFVGSGTAAGQFAAAVQRGLLGAGYQIVTDERMVHDATAQLRIGSPTAGVPRFGRPRTMVISAILVGEAQGTIVEQTSVRFETDGVAFSPDAAGRLVAPLAQSTRLRALVPQIVKQSPPSQPQEAVDAGPPPKDEKQERQAREEEEAAWIAARVEACRQPAALTSCDALRMFLVRYQTGSHLQEGTAALKQAEPGLAALQKDENEWQRSGSSACVPGATKDACVGVEIYVAKYPAGLHAVDAQRLLDQAKAKVRR